MMYIDKTAPFFNSRLKVDRAKRHIIEFNNGVIDYIKSKPYRVVVEQNSKSLHYQWMLKVRNEVPHDFAAIIGDVVHNLRTSLDLLAVDLVEMNGGNTKDVYFPFADGFDSLDTAIEKRYISRAGEDVVKIIKSLKPYKGGDDMLRAIHDLDITDKHKTLIPATHYAGIKNMQISNDSGPLITLNNVDVGPIQNGLILVNMPPTVNVDINQYFYPSFKITFGQGQPLEGHPILDTLHKFTEIVNGIINTFTIYISSAKSITDRPNSLSTA